MSKETEEYIKREKECGLKIGDKVLVIRKAEDFENGWNNSWVSPEMTDAIGKIGEVGELSIYGTGIRLHFKDSISNLRFPYFVLAKVDSKNPYKALARGLKKMKKEQQKTEFKPGDFVKVLRKAEDYENGWALPWIEEMDNCVGKVYKVAESSGFYYTSNGIPLHVEEETGEVDCFPEFVLEKVEKSSVKIIKNSPKFYSFLAKEFDIFLFFKDFYKDNLKWALVEFPDKEKNRLYTRIKYFLDLTKLNKKYGEYLQTIEEEGKVPKILYYVDIPKSETKKVLKKLRNLELKRFRVHCEYMEEE